MFFTIALSNDIKLTKYYILWGSLIWPDVSQYVSCNYSTHNILYWPPKWTHAHNSLVAYYLHKRLIELGTVILSCCFLGVQNQKGPNRMIYWLIQASVPVTWQSYQVSQDDLTISTGDRIWPRGIPQGAKTSCQVSLYRHHNFI